MAAARALAQIAFIILLESRLLDDCVPFWFPRCVDRHAPLVLQFNAPPRILICHAVSTGASCTALTPMG